jgi:hypothetical protein
MKTRNGKIAQLPKPIRDDLNHRLENGKQSPELLKWLNSLPETKDLLAQKFDNQPITPSNISDWRHGGFQDWRADQIREARIQRICETGGSLEKAEAGDLFENFARITIAEMMVNLDAVQKLSGEKRAERMHHLVRDLSRLQNAYNRSRWADLAWTKYNDTFPKEPSELVSPHRNQTEAGTQTPNFELPTTTSSAPIPIVPDRAESQAVDPEDPEPKPDGNGMYVLHFTNCNCDEPCPKCHAPDSDYPLEDAIRDRRYYRKTGQYPCDRRGKRRFLINVACGCPCDRCAEKTDTTALVLNAIPACRAEALAEAGRAALPHCPIIHHAESRDENPDIETNPIPPLITPLPISPLPPAQLADFTRRMALLKSLPQ